MSEQLTPVPEQIRQHILSALTSLQFGTVAISIHDARVVQVEKSEKHRFN